jgi:phosphoglycerate dehydrogenase-like enzyme
MATSRKPLIIMDPFPRTYHGIFRPAKRIWLEENYEMVVAPDGEALADERFTSVLDEAAAIVSLRTLERDELAIAPKLKVIFNPGGNFKQNVDYEYCADHRIHVLNLGGVYPRRIGSSGKERRSISSQGMRTPCRCIALRWA